MHFQIRFYIILIWNWSSKHDHFEQFSSLRVVDVFVERVESTIAIAHRNLIAFVDEAAHFRAPYKAINTLELDMQKCKYKKERLRTL